MRTAGFLLGVLAVVAVVSAAIAQEQPSAIELPARYRGTEIERALQSRDWPRAEETLVAAIEQAPKAVDLLKLLGRVFLIDRKPLNAAVALKKAEAIEPLDAVSRFTLALAYVSLKRGDWARPELERLAASDPGNVTYQYWLGRLDYDAGQYAAAIRRYERVIAKDPSFLRAYDNLGLSYEALNQTDQAVAQDPEGRGAEPARDCTGRLACAQSGKTAAHTRRRGRGRGIVPGGASVQPWIRAGALPTRRASRAPRPDR